MANVRVYVRTKIDGKRNYFPAPHVPDLTACYYLRYEDHGRQTWKRVGHYDSVAKAKLCLERQLFAEANGYLLPAEERTAEAPFEADTRPDDRVLSRSTIKTQDQRHSALEENRASISQRAGPV
jgi:hypothetical protein